MNVKKLISSVSAMAITASAFAGLAVTASAADYEVDEVLYGVKSNGVVTAQTDFTGDNAATLESARTYAGTTFLDGSVLSFKDNALTTDFAETVTSGKVHFGASYTVIGGQTNLVKVVDSTGKTVIGLYPVDSRDSKAIDLLNIDTVNTANGYIYTPRNVAYRAEVDIDLDAKTYSYSVLACSKGSGGTVSQTSTYTGNGTISNISDVKGISFAKNTNGYYVDNLYLYSEKSKEQLYTYTVNYKFNDEVIKTDSAKVPASTVITAETFFTVGAQKYYITAAEAPTLTVTAEGENVLDVPVRAANIYNVSVNAAGEVSKNFVTDTVVEGESYTYTIPRYIEDNGTVYEAAKLSNGSYYKESMTNVTADYSKDVTYTKAYENVVVFDELDGSTDKSADVRASNGSSYNNTAYTSATLSAGTYVAVVGFANVGRNSTLTVGGTTLIDAKTATKNAWVTYTTEEFTVEDGATLSWNKGDSAFDPIDTVIIYSVTAEPTKYTVTLINGDKTETHDVEDGEQYTLPTLVNDGDYAYVFTGWKLVKEGVEDAIIELGGTPITVTEDVTYEAVWTIEPTFDEERIGIFTEYDGNPAVAFKGTATAGTYAISGLRWVAMVDENNIDSVDIDVNIAADTSVVVGLVVEAENVDVNAIEAYLGTTIDN